MSEKTREDLIDDLYESWSTRDLAERVVDLEEDAGVTRAEIVRLRDLLRAETVRADAAIRREDTADAEIEELKEELTDARVDLEDAHKQRAFQREEDAGRIALLRADVDGIRSERDRFKSAWQSARRRAKTAIGAWRYMQWRVDQHEEERRNDAEFQRFLWGQLQERSQERNRNHAAWLSARRRAAHESAMATDAVEHLRRERDRWRAGHERAEAQLVHVRRENERLRAYVADVKVVRGWAFDGSEDCPLRFLREVHESTHELEAAERERRPFVDRTHRRVARGDFDEVR